VINFISHLPRDLRSGGFSAMNAAALSAIEALDQVNYVGPIPLTSDLAEKLVSKALRSLGLPGAFHQYSAQRLAAIAGEVAKKSDPSATVDFFHGFTPWIATAPSRPYLAWSDCTFVDYMAVYHKGASFSASDLRRISALEGAWLSGAAKVMFTSQWAADRAVADYSLAPEKVGCVGIFGEIVPPDHDAYAGAPDFLFVSTNFAAKGGDTVLAAFRQVRSAHPAATLTVVGEAPNITEPGVTFAGFLRKEVPQENDRFRELLGQARALVHPTRSDIAPLILVEAALFGCPTITSRRFAIGELVDHGRSGLLLDDPTDAGALAAAMLRLLDDETAYRAYRRAAWCKARSEHSRPAFDARMHGFVREFLS